MSVSAKLLKSPLAVGTCITIVVTIAGTAFALLHPRQDATAANLASNSWMPVKDRTCKTVVFDPQPPINVRSTPIEQKGNLVGAIENGVELTILAEKDGWYQISVPVSGWIYKNLTKTDCGTPKQIAAVATAQPVVTAPSPSIDQGSKVLEKAIAHYQAGNLQGAIALAQSIPMESAAYDEAQVALRTMPQKWKQAKSKYTTAQQALQDSRWNDVLRIATEFPDIRFWRQQLAPIVKRATLMQHFLGSDDK